MKKAVLFILILLVLVLSSCQTSVDIGYMYPSDVDMSHYRHLAVMNVVPYRGSVPSSYWIGGLDVMAGHLHIRSTYSSGVASDIAEYATDRLYSVLSDSGYYDLLDPGSTSWILNSGYRVSERLRDMGYDAVMIPRIEDMTVDEHIYTQRNSERVWDPERKEYRTEYCIVDIRTERVVSRRTFIDSASRSESFDPFWPRFDGIEILFRRMIRGFDEGIRRSYVPTFRDYSLNLVDNKPEVKSLEGAYDKASDGHYREAYDMFLSSWNESHHVPSGCNAAILAAALGDFEEAVRLIGEVRSYSPGSEAAAIYDDLTTLKRRNDEAMAQFDGSVSESPDIDITPGLSVYDYLLR